MPRRKAGRMSELKPCPFRVHGERTASLTVEGEYYYNETFMPCMRSECACFHNNYDDPYCDRNGSYMKLAQKGEKNDQRRGD